MLDQKSDNLLYSASQRPEELNKHIKSTFMKISRSKPRWGFCGDDKYNLFGLDDYKLFDIISKDVITGCSDYNIIDIGSGNSIWAKNIAKYINANLQMAEGTTIKIFSLTGEYYGNTNYETIGRCQLHNLQQFEIENLDVNLADLGFDLEKKVNFIVSRYCFSHLHDPIRTFMKAYDLLSPALGYMFIDGLPIFISDLGDPYDQEAGSYNFKPHTKLLLELLNEPFLYNSHGSEEEVLTGMCELVIKRTSEHRCSLPLRFNNIKTSSDPNGQDFVAEYNLTNIDRENRDITDENESLRNFLKI